MSLAALFGIEDADWIDLALCAQTDPEAFFPEKSGSTREAKKVCLSCEVRDECLRVALDNDERFGIWGGLSERERRKLKKRTATPAPQPTLQPAPEEAPAMPTEPLSYVEQIITVMAATEGHPDPVVRAARKVVANALVALNKTLRGEAPTSLAAVPALPEQATKLKAARVNNSGPLAARIAALGVTARDIRTWAVDCGILDVPARGCLPARLVDAYEDAHKAAS